MAWPYAVQDRGPIIRTNWAFLGNQSPTTTRTLIWTVQLRRQWVSGQDTCLWIFEEKPKKKELEIIHCGQWGRKKIGECKLFFLRHQEGNIVKESSMWQKGEMGSLSGLFIKIIPIPGKLVKNRRLPASLQGKSQKPVDKDRQCHSDWDKNWKWNRWG